ncbi:MAG: ParB/RepB/Spo0J family partition protein [Capsulimonas sp.]|uniref:ParB/RepB/Spo0J family partition protein n=1 Tax=Capsulimonas sp. TaxID=2494211 RepID=UPI0032658029
MTNVQNVPLDQILTNEGQPRKSFYQESLEELATSIKERGVLEPIVVRPFKGPDGSDKFQIVMGERRYRASRLAGLKAIPAVIKEMSDEDAQADALLENFQREDLNPIEKARAIQGLLTFMSWEKCGKTLGVSETTLRRSLELLELPLFVQNELALRAIPGQTTLSEGHARALGALNHDPATQKRLVEKIKAEKLNLGDAEKIIDAINKYPDKREAFLRVPIQITDQLLKTMGVRAEKAKPYKPATAEQHMKAIDKIGNQLSDLLDERVIEYLSAVQMNQLLATCAELQRGLDEFNRKVRLALKSKEFGFQETYIHCPLCGRVELVGSLRCSVCWSILRRCYDCGNYDRPAEKCGVNNAQIYVNEAENPKEYSKSYKCPDYKPKYEAQAVKTLKIAA